MPPPVPTKKERESIWQLAYAHGAFNDTLSFIKQFKRAVKEDNAGDLVPLTTAVYVAFARSFKGKPDEDRKNDPRPPGVGRYMKWQLSPDIVPAQWKELHERMISMRDQLVAHKDLGVTSAAWGSPSEVIIDFTKGDLRVSSLWMVLGDPLVEKLEPLIQDLLLHVTAELRKLTRKFLPNGSQPDGRYVINHGDDPDWLKVYVPGSVSKGHEEPDPPCGGAPPDG